MEDKKLNHIRNINNLYNVISYDPIIISFSKSNIFNYISIDFSDWGSNIKLILEKGAKITLMHYTDSKNYDFDIELKEKSQFKHYTIVSNSEYKQLISLNKNSQYEGFFLSDNSGVFKMDAQINGEKASCIQRGIVLGNKNEKYETIIDISHNKKNSYSNQEVRQILNDQSIGSFYGNIKVNKNCDHTNANQLNKNLLLSKHAKVISEPELNILTDDVKCTHGSTIGNIDQNALYYMKSRGISEKNARLMLIEGFLTEIISHIDNEFLFNSINKIIKNWIKNFRVCF